MGFGAINNQLSAAQIRDSLASLSGANRLDATAIKNLSGGGLTSWQLKTANYTAVAGDRLRIDATEADVVITLPASPSADDADIWIQRLDLTTNKVLLRTGANKINGQPGQDGVFAPLAIQLIERVSYVNNAIGWLGQYDRLTYQTQPAVGGNPPFANVVVLLPFDGTLVDASLSPKVFANVGTGSVGFVAGNPFGAGSQSMTSISTERIEAVNSQLDIAANTDFCVEGWNYFNTWGSGGSFNSPRSQYLFNFGTTQILNLAYSEFLGGKFAVMLNNAQVLAVTAPTPAINTWHFWQLQRSGSTCTLYWNGVTIGSFTYDGAISTEGRLWIAGLTAGGDNLYSVNGRSSNFRFTKGSIVSTAIPTTPFPTS